MIAQQQSAVATPASTWFSFLNRERTIARPGYSRWLIPPAALCIHLCIGQAYAFSVFNLPMTKLIGVTQATPADWSLTEFSRFRLQFAVDHSRANATDHQLLLQYIVSLGAHGAHTF